jgi:hypothetical protein
MTDTAQSTGGDSANRTILINFVLDRSGSMMGARDATISGFNEFKNDQTSEEGDAFFTLTLFDTRFDTVAAAVPVREVPDLDYSTYAPDGMTALYDAIGHTIRLTDDFVAANKPDQVMFVIMTDGGENSSREFSNRQIFDLIRDRQENAEYEFIFLGANQDSYAVTQDMGMHAGRSVDFDASAEGSAMAMKRASRNVSAHRRHGDKMRDDFFSAELEGLGAIEPEEWKRMTPEERKRHLDEGRGAGA